MNRLITVLLACTILLTSCQTEPKELPLQAKIDSLESKLYHVSDTLQQLRKQVEEDKMWSTPRSSSQSISDNEVYESDDNNVLSRIIDDNHGEGHRYVFAVIEYVVEGSSWSTHWYSDITSLANFSPDMQARFLDECIRHIRDYEPDVFRKSMRVLHRKAYMSYSYSSLSKKHSQLKDGI